MSFSDNYDSLNPRSDTDDILLPFRNLINEQYLYDFSKKIRANLDIKRKNGEFVAAFAPYGYKRDTNDKHKLVVDEYAATVVREIFRLKIEGLSKLKIAEKLNAYCEPSPAEYKKANSNYVSMFQTREKALWSNVAVGRILSNPVYTGILVQGKQTTPNHKVKSRILKKQTEWRIVENAHDPIVSKLYFETVQLLLRQDTRSQASKPSVYPLSGFLYCGDCGNSMTRSMSGKYTYYVCASSLKGGGCSSHCILDRKLEEAVFCALSKQFSLNRDIIESLEGVITPQPAPSSYLEARIRGCEEELKLLDGFKSSLCADCKDGILSGDDFETFNLGYSSRIKELQRAIRMLQREARAQSEGASLKDGLGIGLGGIGSTPELSRKAVVSLIKRIEIFKKKRIVIKMRCRDRLEENSVL